MLEKILVPLDGSTLAEKALPYAQALAQKFDAELVLIRVLPPMVIMPDAEPLSPYSAAVLQKWESEAKSYLNRLQTDLHELHIPTQTDVLEGSPVAEMILETACAQAVDLIVMSTHGYSGSDRWIYGSVANKVLQHAPCPVFLVRAKGNCHEPLAPHQ